MYWSFSRLARESGIRILRLTRCLGALALGCGPAAAQDAPDLVVVNARVVTVDDTGFSDGLGSIAEGLAVGKGTIQGVGASAAMRDLAGPGARVLDLGGRTVLPGLVVVHEHPNDWDPVTPAIVRGVLDDDVVIARFLEGTPQQQLNRFPVVLREAVAAARPGQWIYIVFTFGKHYEYGFRGNSSFGPPGLNFTNGKLLPKSLLDSMAPDNPVVVRDVFIGMFINQRAYEAAREIYPTGREGFELVRVSDPRNENGKWGNFRWMFSDVIMRQHYPLYRRMAQLGESWWAGYGMTTYASECYSARCMRVYTDLDRSGEKLIRTMFKWNWRQPHFFDDEDDDYFTNFLIWAQGRGSDYWWYGGTRPVAAVGLSCTRLESRVKREDSFESRCAWDPGSEDRERMLDYIRAGGRLINIHTSGDRDIDNLLDVIEEASREAGFTEKEIRERRHGFDHLVLSPRKDQLERMKRLGMVAGGNAMEIYQVSPGVLKEFGEEALEQVVPKRSLQEAGIASGFEVDRALGATDLTIFWNIARTIDRRAWDGKSYGTGQGLTRQAALKSATAWGAYYLMKEDRLGSLEPGKLADFIVLDRDYLAIPEEEIEQIRVLMTVVGGRIIHLVPSLARELGLQPRGAQVELGFHPAGW